MVLWERLELLPLLRSRDGVYRLFDILNWRTICGKEKGIDLPLLDGTPC